MSQRDITCTANFGKSTLSRFNKFNQGNDEASLAKILNPSLHKAGKPTMLKSEEKTMVFERLILAAKRGFAADKEDVSSL